MNLLTRAICLATEAHDGQTDKTGDAYIFHPLRVMERVRTGFIPAGVDRTEAMVVAVLHDTVEDTDVTLTQIKHMFGEQISFAVYSVTKMPDETYIEFVSRALHNPTGRVVKYYDIMDNSDPVRLFLLPEETRNKLIKKYNQAKALF